MLDFDKLDELNEKAANAGTKEELDKVMSEYDKLLNKHLKDIAERENATTGEGSEDKP